MPPASYPHQLPPGLLRNGVKLVIDQVKGHAVYRFITITSGARYSMGYREFYLLLSLSHQYSIDETRERYRQDFDQDITQSDIISFKSFILQSGLFNLKYFTTLIEQNSDETAEGAPPFRDDIDYTQPQSSVITGGKKKKQAPMISLFNPNHLFKGIAQLFHPFHFIIYLLPLALIVSLVTLSKNFSYFEVDFVRLWQPASIFQHVLFSLFTVNLLSKVAAGATIRYYGADVNKFGIVIILGILPRFFVDLRGGRQLPRQSRLWLYASAPLMKLALFTLGILLWKLTRNSGTMLPMAGIALSMTCVISFIITANPLITSDGYRWLSDFLKEKNLLPRAYSMLFGLFNGKETTPLNISLLTYAIASLLYIIMLAVLIIIIVGSSLVGALKGVGLILFVVFLVYNVQRIYHNIRVRKEERNRADKRRAKSGNKKEMDWYHSFIKARQQIYQPRRLLLFIQVSFLFPLLFVPYSYEASGRGEVISIEKQQIHSSVAGIISEVYFDGGNRLTAGTTVARLDDYDQRLALEVNQANINKQRALIERLESLPREEERLYFQHKLQRARSQLYFSQQLLNQYEQLHRDELVSLENWETVRKRYEVDAADLAEASAELEQVESGAHPEQLLAERLKLDSLLLEQDYRQKQLAKTELKMPFDGILSSVQLSWLQGQYIEQGGLFAHVEAPDHVVVEISVAENEISDITIGATTRLKLLSYPHREFSGEVTSIESHVSDNSREAASRVQARINNPDQQIKPGMSGYAKIITRELPFWEAMGRALMRFIMVELWSWLP